MPKCDNCEQEYDELIAYVKEENKYRVSFDDQQKSLDWSTSEVVDDTETQIQFCCPHCGHPLGVWTKNSRDAMGAVARRLLV